MAQRWDHHGVAPMVFYFCHEGGEEVGLKRWIVLLYQQQMIQNMLIDGSRGYSSCGTTHGGIIMERRGEMYGEGVEQ